MRFESQRGGAEFVARKLRDAGFESYFAGGCVRDRLLGDVPKDYDVVTNAKPEEVSVLFKRTLHVGAAFGVVKVLLGPGFEYEVATYRTDGIYIDGRRPDEVRYSKSAEEDVKRRDFTFNALLEDPMSGEIIDYVGGRADLEAHVIRAVGDADKRMAEDRLRMMRAVRFAARFGFVIEDQTKAAIRAHASQIHAVSAERITSELEGIWISGRAPLGLSLLKETELLPHVLSFLAEERVPLVEKAFERLPRDPESARWIAWGLLFLGLDKKAIEKQQRELKLSRDHLRAVRALIDAAPVLANGSKIDLMRLAVSDRAPLYRDWAHALDQASRWDPIERELIDDPLPQLPLLTGDDLKSSGLLPGPMFKEVLDAAEIATLDRTLRTRQDAELWLHECSKNWTMK